MPELDKRVEGMSDEEFSVVLSQAAEDWRAVFPPIADWLEEASQRIDDLMDRLQAPSVLTPEEAKFFVFALDGNGYAITRLRVLGTYDRLRRLLPEGKGA